MPARWFDGAALRVKDGDRVTTAISGPNAFREDTVSHEQREHVAQFVSNLEEPLKRMRLRALDLDNGFIRPRPTIPAAVRIQVELKAHDDSPGGHRDAES